MRLRLDITAILGVDASKLTPNLGASDAECMCIMDVNIVTFMFGLGVIASFFIISSGATYDWTLKIELIYIIACVFAQNLPEYNLQSHDLN